MGATLEHGHVFTPTCVRCENLEHRQVYRPGARTQAIEGSNGVSSNLTVKLRWVMGEEHAAVAIPFSGV
jgi:hypothetical protein